MGGATWKKVGPKAIHIMVDWPGYHLDGEVLEAKRAVLTVGKSVKYDIGVFLVLDPDTGEEFGIPIERGTVMSDRPIIDMRGRLKCKSITSLPSTV